MDQTNNPAPAAPNHPPAAPQRHHPELYAASGIVSAFSPPIGSLHDQPGPAAPGLTQPAITPDRYPPPGYLAPPPYQRYREMTIDELLLENRVVFLVGEINHASATGVIMRLLHLQNTKRGVDINLYVNSPGGAVDDTLAIYDTMQFLACDVATYCIGKAMSGGAIVVAAGAKGKRFSLPHAKIMIHQPYGGVYGQTSDVQIQAEEILKTKAMLNELLAQHTGQDIKRIEEDSERDRYFSAKEAKAYGLVDDVIERAPAQPQSSS